MAQKTKDPKNTYKVSGRPILSLLIGLGFFTVIMLATMLSASNNIKNKSNPNSQTVNQDGVQTVQDSQAADPDNNKLLAVVTAIDLDNKQITLYDVDQQESLTLNYTGGTDITDKYGQVIAMSQIDIGTMVDVAYRKDKNKLTDMSVSTKAWEYVGVNNLSIDRTDRIMKIASTKYKYNDDVVIIDGEEFIPVTDLAEQDELTVWGYDQTIWSITVTRGHGTVVLEDYDAFLGANITIGYESMQQITEDLKITVREGTFNLTVENGQFSATKSIRVYRNKTTFVSLSDLGPGAPQLGEVTFEITPFGADLTIDNEITSYANPVELLYGDHKLKVSLGGYITYEGILNVDSAGKTIRIDLPESTSNGQAQVSETDSSNVAPGTSDTQTGGTDPTTGSDSTTGTDITDEGDSTTGNYTGDAKVDTGHKIYVQKPLGASVYIDGEYMCTSPGSFNKIIGSHVITFIKDGYKTMSYTIEVGDDGLDTYFTFPDLVTEAGN